MCPFQPRISARQCRNRKKERVKDMEQRYNALANENRHLKTEVRRPLFWLLQKMCVCVCVCVVRVRVRVGVRVRVRVVTEEDALYYERRCTFCVCCEG